ncbi:hypothetical protein [Vibrio parahaemolyticus]|uniref:hypothetical protein n=1 Tax=Vibrio parahaemolyticus TaxID=670 RepID=UPI0024AF6DAC|nr:hypothetical protein [Vibrio parahaemolyticus]MDI7855077.1 hypothetical protein [Vibrio parahaemolyticus]
MATAKANTRTTRKPEAGSKTTATTDDKSTGTDETVVTGEAGPAGSGDTGAGDTNTGTGTEGTGEEGSESGDTSTGTDGDNAGAEGSELTGSTDTGAGDLPEGDDSALEVLMTNNSVSGHEILRADGSILAIDGHCKDLSITTNKEELVAIQSALADKPWVEIKLKAE